MIYFAFDAQGAFIAGCAETGATCYAYPSSPHAQDAKRKPAATAEEMVGGIGRFYRGFDSIVKPYDARNWAKLSALVL